MSEIIALLLELGADPNQRGINDYTALHMAVGEDNLPAVELLLAAGADRESRTRIDDYETPLELAHRAGLTGAAAPLAARIRAPTPYRPSLRWKKSAALP